MVSLVSSSWLVVGDLNAILGARESFGLHSPACNSYEDFKSVIGDYDLIGIRSQGAHFTWDRGRYPRTRLEKRLDRALVSKGCISCWRDISCVALPRRFLDHFPLVIRLSDIVNVSPWTFWFQCMWLDHPDFMALVRHIWSSSYVDSSRVETDFSVVEDVIPSLVTDVENTFLISIPSTDNILDAFFDMDAASVP
ncbi:hypothetical protein Ddye_010439 [Dipteronia dyeriana]|uniref:Endonuclease/exonuclease/phosphatase domain-containing protein n=1 Tax=Dipteronia dyeriana TaxID=168575 RepID=A0AAD9XDN5_9ROSI|nr:hypothetical protein Ddye_010434 [Dipteronia dyeriana]KAK2657387.1 hypothetical protein Ddye_010439 [Dipteronia dyeriana]